MAQIMLVSVFYTRGQRKTHITYNRTPPLCLTKTSEYSSSLRKNKAQKKETFFVSPVLYLLTSTYFQSQLTSQNKHERRGKRWNTSLQHNALVWQLLGLTFEAIGTLLKEQMLTDVQEQEHGNYTSGWRWKKYLHKHMTEKNRGGGAERWQAHA